MNEILTAINSFRDNLMQFVVPAGIIGLVLWGLAQLLAPIIPDWAQSMKGYFQRACIVLVVISFAATLVNGLYSLGGSRSAPKSGAVSEVLAATTRAGALGA